MWSRTKSYGRLTGYITKIMRIFPCSSSTLHKFLLGTSYVRPSHPTDGVTAFHVPFLFYIVLKTHSCLTVFLTEDKSVFHFLILYLVRLVNGCMSGHLYFGQASTYRPWHTYLVTVLLFMCLYVQH